jgi:glycosyltransferase involved in cell wall biosynthesis
MVSVIIAAHNEESVIGSCLDALRDQRTTAQLQVIVSANGCSDRTAEVAAAHGATVVDRAEPGKPGALNAAERIATSFPRVYLDADILVPLDAIDLILGELAASSSVHAVVPRRRIDTRGRPFPVRAYFAINERLPAFRDGLFGRGMITLSEAGRARFGEFPLMVADDLFVDSLFSTAEKAEAKSVEVVVQAPYRTQDLAHLRAAAGELTFSVRPSDKWAWLRDVVVPQPRLVPAAVPYLAITLAAAVLARRSAATDWGHDASTRADRVDDDRTTG